MRILMIAKACVVGTYQRKLEEMARLPDVDLTVIVPPVWRDPSGDVKLERAHVDGYRMLVEPMRFNGNFHLHYFPTLARRLDDCRPDVVHIDEEPYNVATWHALWLARRAGAKSLFFSWQNIRRDYPLPFSIGERWVLHNVDHAIMGTDSAVDVWRAKGYRKPLTVIPQFGVDPTIFAPAERRPAGRGFVFGYVGRLVPEKGVDLLIRALARIKGVWRLEIIGQGPERDNLQRLAASLNLSQQIAFTGQVPSTRMPAFYRELDALVIPSRTLPNWKEQFGRVIIEAMACGVPVIGSDSGAIPDVIGDSGLIFPEDDVVALVDRLQSLVQDEALCHQLAACGRTRVLATFTHAQVAAQTVEVYRAMCSG
ncbi:MAG: glycosyltransferase family 4 protein [Anaerolineae bacterium]|nr:glycosyltransferase family 4 protein [Anaerolineae bacterium]